MFSPTVMPVRITRACGHSEVEELSYRGLRDKSQQQGMARCIFCKDCKVLVEAWLGAQNCAAPYPVELPVLIGSDRQVAWAETIRDEQLKRLLPAMTATVECGGKVGASVWQALYALVTQRQAKFWIDSRVLGFSHYYIEVEAVYFAMGITYGAVFSERSVFGRLKKSAPYLIDEVKRRCPVAPAFAHA